jgi:hypothetical protein
MKDKYLYSYFPVRLIDIDAEVKIKKKAEALPPSTFKIGGIFSFSFNSKHRFSRIIIDEFLCFKNALYDNDEPMIESKPYSDYWLKMLLYGKDRGNFNQIAVFRLHIIISMYMHSRYVSYEEFERLDQWLSEANWLI